MANRNYEHRPIPVTQSDQTSKVNRFLDFLNSLDSKNKKAVVESNQNSNYWQNFNPAGGWVINRDPYTGQAQLFYRGENDELQRVPDENVLDVVNHHTNLLNREWQTAVAGNPKPRETPVLTTAEEPISKQEHERRKTAYEVEQGEPGAAAVLGTILPSYWVNLYVDNLSPETVENLGTAVDIGSMFLGEGANAVNRLGKKALSKLASRSAEKALIESAEKATQKDLGELIMNFSKKNKSKKNKKSYSAAGPVLPGTPKLINLEPTVEQVTKTPKDYVINTPNGETFTIPKGTDITIDPDGNYIQHKGINFAVNPDGSLDLHGRPYTTPSTMQQWFPGYKVTPSGNSFNFSADLKVDPTLSVWQRLFTRPTDQVPLVKWKTRIPFLKKTNPESLVARNKTMYRDVVPTIKGDRGNYTIGIEGEYTGNGDQVTEIMPTSELPLAPMKRTWSPLRTLRSSAVGGAAGLGLFNLGKNWWNSKYPYGYNNTYNTTDMKGNNVKWEIWQDPKSKKQFVIDTNGKAYYFVKGKPDFSRLVTEFVLDPTGHRVPADEVNDQSRQVEISNKPSDQDTQKQDSAKTANEHILNLSTQDQSEVEQPVQVNKNKESEETQKSSQVNKAFGSPDQAHLTIPLYFKNRSYYV